MLSPDHDVLLYVNNNPHFQQDSIVAPIAAALRRHWPGELLVADVRQVHVWLGKHPAVIIGDRPVLPGRTFARIFSGMYGPVLSKSLEALGSRVVNTPSAVLTAKSKFHTAALLQRAGLPVPAQVLFAGNPASAALAEQSPLGWPRVVKADTGLGGREVWLAHNDEDVATQSYHPEWNDPWIAQQFRADAAGVDVRVLVAAGRVIGAMERRADTPGEFRSNLKQGGTATRTELSEQEADIALRATDAVGLTIAGVDLLRTDDGPMITEVNANPGFTGIGTVLGEDLVYDAVAKAAIHG